MGTLGPITASKAIANFTQRQRDPSFSKNPVDCAANDGDPFGCQAALRTWPAPVATHICECPRLAFFYARGVRWPHSVGYTRRSVGEVNGDRCR